jgi:prepilin-type N-terminal cleavage/methylation domain-containing protein
MKKIKREKDIKMDNSGFTLIEVLVAMAIFSTAIMVAFSIFISSQNLQQRTLAIQRGQSDARYALELIARKFRLGEIDYEYYVSNGIILTNPAEILALRDSDGLPVRFQLASEAIQICTNFTQEGMSKSGSELCNAWADITPNNITITRLAFYLSPDQDPFILDSATGEYLGGDNQERLTMVLESTINQVKGEDYQTKFQTTISSRVYKR